MNSRLRRLGDEGAKFAAVNVLATVVALVLFNLMVHGLTGWFDGPLNDRPLTSYFLANTVGMLISFYGSRHYVFRHRRPSGPGGGFVNYAIVNFASFSIPIACLWFSRNVLGLESIYADNLSGNVVGALLGAVARFWAFRTFVFKRPAEFTPQHPRHAAKHEPLPGMHVWMGSVDPDLFSEITGVPGEAAGETDRT